jgi:two-component sensor histidine kinase
MYEADQFAVFNTAIQRAIEDGEPYDITLKLELPGGIVKWVRAICQPDAEKGPAGHFLRGTIQDITDIKRIEAALRRTTERLRIKDEINSAILRAQSSAEIAQAALTRLHPLISCRYLSIAEMDPGQQRGRDTIILFDGEIQSHPSAWRPMADIGPSLLHDIRHGHTAVVDDLTSLASRSPLQQELADLGIRATASVPLRMHDTALGTLNAASETPDFFQPQHVQILEGVAASLAVALQQAHLLEQTRSDAETKDLLLREVNHRVKNNLDAIIGLLYVERRYAPPGALPVYRPIMEDLTRRISSLAQVHQMLSESEWAPLRADELAEQIIRTIARGAPQDCRLDLDLAPSPVRIDPAQAQHLALILSELTTNTLKYAAADRDTVTVTVQISPEGGTIKLVYRDDGPGYPQDVLSLARHSAGLEIIQRSAATSLRGSLTLRNENGAVTEIRFPKEQS